MKPPRFDYHDPETVPEVVGLLKTLPNARMLAGGQSLMPMLNMRLALPDHLVDLNRVEGLAYIRETGGALEIGAMTRQRDLEFSDAVRARWPIMHEALLQVGHRRRATGARSAARSAISIRRQNWSRSRPAMTRPSPLSVRMASASCRSPSFRSPI